MTVLRAITLLGALSMGVLAYADDDGLPFGNTEACMEGPLAQFGQYIGDWKIEDSSLAQDGSGWSEGQGARWIFTCLGNAWSVDQLPGFSHIRAELNEEGNIVMHYVDPRPTPLRRITFFPADESGWKWKLELSNDDGANWFEVYRITATRYVTQ